MARERSQKARTIRKEKESNQPWPGTTGGGLHDLANADVSFFPALSEPAPLTGGTQGETEMKSEMVKKMKNTSKKARRNAKAIETTKAFFEAKRVTERYIKVGCPNGHTFTAINVYSLDDIYHAVMIISNGYHIFNEEEGLPIYCDDFPSCPECEK